MSEPKRYKVEELNCCFSADMVESPEGEYVLHSDYARLKAEFDKYRKAVTISADSVIDERNSLKAEVERLERLVNYWRIEANVDHDRWLRSLEEIDHVRKLK